MNQQGFDASAGAGALSKLFAHFDRTKLLNPRTGEYEFQRYPWLTIRGGKRSTDYSEIDTTRTHLNYNLAADDQTMGQAAFLEKRLGEIYVHKSALKNALVDWVVTLPDMEQYAGREREFFEAAYAALCDRYGRENVVSAYVHMDEAQPHMHFAFVPVAKDEKHAQGWKLSRKAVNTCERTVTDAETGAKVVKRDTREFSRAAHEYVEARVCEAMGLEQAGVVLTDEQRAKRTIKQNLEGPMELKQAQEQLEKMRLERDETLREAASLASERDSLRDEVSSLRKALDGLERRFIERRGELNLRFDS